MCLWFLFPFFFFLRVFLYRGISSVVIPRTRIGYSPFLSPSFPSKRHCSTAHAIFFFLAPLLLWLRSSIFFPQNSFLPRQDPFPSCNTFRVMYDPRFSWSFLGERPDCVIFFFFFPASLFLLFPPAFSAHTIALATQACSILPSVPFSHACPLPIFKFFLKNLTNTGFSLTFDIQFFTNQSANTPFPFSLLLTQPWWYGLLAPLLQNRSSFALQAPPLFSFFFFWQRDFHSNAFLPVVLCLLLFENSLVSSVSCFPPKQGLLFFLSIGHDSFLARSSVPSNQAIILFLKRNEDDPSFLFFCFPLPVVLFFPPFFVRSLPEIGFWNWPVSSVPTDLFFPPQNKEFGVNTMDFPSPF